MASGSDLQRCGRISNQASPVYLLCKQKHILAWTSKRNTASSLTSSLQSEVPFAVDMVQIILFLLRWILQWRAFHNLEAATKKAIYGSDGEPVARVPQLACGALSSGT